MLGGLRAQIIEPVVIQGLPGKSDFEAIEKLADNIGRKHEDLDGSRRP
jgi:hypothetical protein